MTQRVPLAGSHFSAVAPTSLSSTNPGRCLLKEAELQADGEHLDEVGGRIVAEVFMGLLEKDPSSYLRSQPTWTPFLPATTEGEFTMGDLISFSGHGLDVIGGPG